MTVFIFDGTFEGLLTAIFEFYERRPGPVQLVWDRLYQPGMLEDTLEIINDEAKAKRVWAGLQKKLSTPWQETFYKVHLSENAQAYQDLFDFARYIFDNPEGAEANFGNPHVMALARMDRKIHRERHRMKAFIRFQETADGMYYASIDPDFNVLPLIISFFKNRYADQQWIIYDLKRKYGFYYDTHSVQEITYDFINEVNSRNIMLPAAVLDPKEELASILWKDYFNSTNIPARKNMKLHIQHIPRRYWKYLTEKEGKSY